MASDQGLPAVESLFLEALRYGIAGAPVPWTEPPELSAQKALAHLARAQVVQPLIVEALSACPAMSDSPVLDVMKRETRALVLRQARRTAEFLLLLRQLDSRGLRPVILKGAICRDLYPQPEQRPSTDEDLLIDPEELPTWDRALLDCGLQRLDPDVSLEGADELAYVDPERELYLELHMQPIVSLSRACTDCNLALEGALARRVQLHLYGETLDTLHPTDHLLYLLCHAYKHLLYGGVGIRQLCDICLFARRYAGELDWAALRSACESLKIQTLSAAFFRFGERRLAIPGPEAFADLAPDEEPLVRDCLTGGLYGANDPDRVHSNALTLDAADADRQGRRRRGLARALFPGVQTMSARYPYLQKRPWLLPAAWVQRLGRYLAEKGAPGETLRIGEERVALLRQYGVVR